MEGRVRLEGKVRRTAGRRLGGGEGVIRDVEGKAGVCDVEGKVGRGGELAGKVVDRGVDIPAEEQAGDAQVGGSCGHAKNLDEEGEGVERALALRRRVGENPAEEVQMEGKVAVGHLFVK